MRDLLRGELVKQEWGKQRREMVGVLALVYDHNTRLIADKLTELQHHRYRNILATLHVHLDAHICLEVLALRGRAGQVRAIADSLIAAKGARHGQLIPATTGKRLR